jgi:hypothetical protein
MPKTYIKDLSGINRILNPLDIKSGDFKLVLNYNSDIASAKKKRPGYEAFLDRIDNFEVYNLISERLSIGRLVLRVSGVSIYKYTFTGSTWGSAVKTNIGHVVNAKQIIGDTTGTGSTMEATTTYMAQGFKTSTTNACQYLDLLLLKVGTPGTLTVRIETDTAGSPSGTLVDANATATIAASAISTTTGWVTTKFTNSFTLVAGDQYHIVIRPSATADGTNYVKWAGTTSNLYSNGSLKKSTNSGSTYAANTTIVDGGFMLYLLTGCKMGHTVLNNLLILGNGGDYTQKYDGVTFTDMTTAPRCPYWLTYKGRAYCFKPDYNGSRGFFSKTNDATSWTNDPNDVSTGNYFDIDPDYHGDIVGAEVIDDRIIVHKEQGSYRIIPDEFGRPSEILPVPTKKTATSHWAITQVNGKSYYPATDGQVYTHTGTEPSLISFAIKDLAEGITDSLRSSLVAGEWRNFYYLSAVGDITENAIFGTNGVARTFSNAVLVFNTLLNEWYLYTFGHKPTCFATFNDSAGKEYLFFGDNNGYTWKFGVGTLDGTLPVHGEIEIWPMYLGQFDSKKDIDYISVMGQMGNEAQILYNFDFGDWQSVGDLKGQLAVRSVLDMGGSRRNIGFKIIDSSTTTESIIYGFGVNAFAWDPEQDKSSTQQV